MTMSAAEETPSPSSTARAICSWAKIAGFMMASFEPSSLRMATPTASTATRSVPARKTPASLRGPVIGPSSTKATSPSRTMRAGL